MSIVVTRPVARDFLPGGGRQVLKILDYFRISKWEGRLPFQLCTPLSHSPSVYGSQPVICSVKGTLKRNN